MPLRSNPNMPRFHITPIQRHETLAPFSRDHYGGLVQARQLKNAANASAPAQRNALAGFFDAWKNEIADHFADEERLLLNRMEPEDQHRMRDEHRVLRHLAAEAREARQSTGPDPDPLRRISQTIEPHIRWEERERFMRMQDQLNPEQLNALE